MKKRRSSKKHTKGVSFSGTVFRIILIICASALVLSYLSIFIDPSVFWFPMFFGLYFIPICFINVILLAISVFKRKMYMIIPIIALIPALFFADLFVKVGNEEKVYHGDNFKILTYNVGRFSAGIKGETPDRTYGRIREFLKEEHADIVCFQEFMTKDTTSFKQLFGEYPYYSYHFFKGNRYFGNITLSKYPIVSSDKITFKKSTNLCILSDIAINDNIIRVYNCHLESYSISFTSVIKRLGKKSDWTDEFMELHGKLKGTNIRRSEQVNDILEQVNKSSHPSVICGDFNDTPISYTYHTLSKNKKDSFVEGGAGFSSTYSVLWPLLRIDYILLPGEYQTDKHKITRVPFSDHYPISTFIYYN